jgi:hypothetical protein
MLFARAAFLLGFVALVGAATGCVTMNSPKSAPCNCPRR